MVADFSISAGVDDTNIIITDKSTPNYGGETIINRYVNIEDSVGVITQYPFPIVNGVGDNLSITLLPGKSYKATLNIVPAITTVGSLYTRLYSYVTVGVYYDYIKSLEDQLIYEVDPRSVLSMPTTLLVSIEWAQFLYDASISYTSSLDIGSAQECLDSLSELSSRG